MKFLNFAVVLILSTVGAIAVNEPTGPVSKNEQALGILRAHAQAESSDLRRQPGMANQVMAGQYTDLDNALHGAGVRLPGQRPPNPSPQNPGSRFISRPGISQPQVSTDTNPGPRNPSKPIPIPKKGGVKKRSLYNQRRAVNLRKRQLEAELEYLERREAVLYADVDF
jgi:hypothetical protein